jgi:hypothetical protein
MTKHPDNRLRAGALNPDPPPPSSVAVNGIATEEQRETHIAALKHELAGIEHERELADNPDLKQRAHEIEQQIKAYSDNRKRRKK